MRAPTIIAGTMIQPIAPIQIRARCDARRTLPDMIQPAPKISNQAATIRIRKGTAEV